MMSYFEIFNINIFYLRKTVTIFGISIRDATGTGNQSVGSRIPYRPAETSFFKPAGLEISSIFSWIFGQFLQKLRVEILCFTYQTSSVDVCGKVY